MTVSFILNNENVVTKVDPNQRLADVLREEFGLTGTKSACHSGHCGACIVLFNNTISPSCLIPAFRLGGSTVVTIEGFAQSEEYQDIVRGFDEAGADVCDYCRAGKIFIGTSILRSKKILSREEIAAAFNSIKCRCTDSETLVNGILAARRRINERE
ncbi:MAG: 2Fe-2S iron-sulfur cluster binding domain-containing protein [Spirochaetaceae bacterium]|jgi:carbon-monoxide dehydrogenase small subunit|nr:2Fe-2S iron-sulfur cluster binding domain-containing protein [Spirochaetaceae bacterium]